MVQVCSYRPLHHCLESRNRPPQHDLTVCLFSLERKDQVIVCSRVSLFLLWYPCAKYLR